MIKLLFILLIMQAAISCSIVKPKKQQGFAAALPVMTLAEASDAIRAIQSGFVSIDNIFDIDSTGNLVFKTKVVFDSVLVKNRLDIGIAPRPQGPDTLIIATRAAGAINYTLSAGSADIESLKWVRDFLNVKIDSLQSSLPAGSIREVK